MQAEIDRSIALAQSRPWRISPWIVICVFAALMLTPALVMLLRAGGAGSNSENRVLAPFPTWADLKKVHSLSRKLETYVNDHFGLRDQLVRANSRVRYAAGLSSNPQQVVIGRDGWLFYARERIMEQHVGADVFAPAELEAWVARMEANRKWLADRGIPFVIMLAPDKNTIYPELLPQYPKRPGVRTRADQIAERLKGSALTFVDPRAAIIAAKAQHPRLYYKGDSHWGHRGAFIAYQMLMVEVARHFPGVSALALDDFNASIEPVAVDLVYLLGLHHDIAYTDEVLTRKPPAARQGVEVRTPVAGAPWGWPISFHRNPNANAPRAVIFGDSFTDYILGPTFLYETLRDPVYTHHNVGNFNFSLVTEVKPDIVIAVIAERYLKTIPGPPIGF